MKFMTKEYHQELEKTVVSVEGCLLLTTKFDTDVVEVPVYA